MKNGGYIIIDLKDVSLSATPVAIAGIYNRVKDNYRKPILLSGIVIEGVEMADCFVDLHVSSTSYVGALHNYNITITSENKVSVAKNN